MDPHFLVAAAQQPPLWQLIAPWLLVFAIFYFVAIAPVRKRQQQLQKTIEALAKGDKVVTNGGIYGEVAAVDRDTVILKVADNVKLRVAKSAVAGLQGKDGEKS